MTFDQDDRAVSTTLSHVLATGITAVLIVGLMFSASSFLQTQQDVATRHEMQTIGNRIANELSRLDELGQRGGSATVHSTYPTHIAGKTYDVRIEHGPECHRKQSTADTCLILDSAATEVAQYVPLANQTRLSLHKESDGRFVLHSVATTASVTRESAFTGSAEDMRTGIGSDFATNVGLNNSLNQRPIAHFTLHPGSPDSSNFINFDASESRDPDGSIVNYEWRFNRSGPTINTSSWNTTYNYRGNPGRYPIQLTVTDDGGKTASTTRNITISGLEYNNDLGTASNNGVTFTMTNNWTSFDTTITSLLVDPPNDVDCDSSWFSGECKVTVTSDSDSSSVTWSETDIPKGGFIVEGLSTTVAAGHDVTITAEGFTESPDAESMSFGVRHAVDGQTNATLFSDVVNSMTVEDFHLEERHDDIYLVLQTDKPIGDVEVSVDKWTWSPETLTKSDFALQSGSTYRYVAKVSGNDGSYHRVELEHLESDSGVDSGESGISDTYWPTCSWSGCT
ncbi:MAG: PKD domain-containing protein [Haloarculaceae archaeon]